MTPEEVINSLSLEEYNKAVIQKVIGGSAHIYVISINSRFPQKFLAFDLLKKTKSQQTYRIKSNRPKIVKLTPPIMLNRFTGNIPTNSYIMVRDLGGENVLSDREIEPMELIT